MKEVRSLLKEDVDVAFNKTATGLGKEVTDKVNKRVGQELSRVQEEQSHQDRRQKSLKKIVDILRLRNDREY